MVLKATSVLLTTIIFVVTPLSINALEPGERAPDFTLQSSDGNSYTLSDYIGNHSVVLAWFPRAFSPGCTLECKSFAEYGHVLDKMGIAYFMASTDNIKRVVKFAKALDAQFPILSDSNKQVSRQYGVLFLGMASKRVTFYIDKDGKIAHVDNDVRPETAAQDIIRKIKELGI
ncbi:MAG: peroxiredoxin [Porticoccaceae bacterium]|nr:peroxiredoxin [Porticoccaceae bacterium]|tara:strand:+ start:3779 stop:4297 length:519 start_codon:yes stop_codon:yes gene_type:complete